MKNSIRIRKYSVNLHLNSIENDSSLHCWKAIEQPYLDPEREQPPAPKALPKLEKSRAENGVTKPQINNLPKQFYQIFPQSANNRYMLLEFLGPLSNILVLKLISDSSRNVLQIKQSDRQTTCTENNASECSATYFWLCLSPLNLKTCTIHCLSYSYLRLCICDALLIIFIFVFYRLQLNRILKNFCSGLFQAIVWH